MLTVTFPAFVVARVARQAIICVMDLSRQESLQVVAGPRDGVASRCLAWFTTQQAADNFIAASGREGRAVPVKNAYQAIVLLDTREFSAVLIDPVEEQDFTTVVEFADFRAMIYQLTGGELPRHYKGRSTAHILPHAAHTPPSNRAGPPAERNVKPC